MFPSIRLLLGQGHGIQQRASAAEAATYSAAPTARLEAAPIQTRARLEFFRSLLVVDSQTFYQISRFVGLSRFHDQIDSACVSYVRKRIRFEDYDVGKIARADLTEFAFLSESLC